jgi:glyoxylase-like metal-dependent hydrolase (beta-lactamase superfamily II)
LASGAIEGARKGFLARSREQLAAMIAAEPSPEAAAPLHAELARIDSLPQLVPDEIVSASGERRLAGRTLRAELESRAVTEGDLWLFDPATRVLVAGDLVTLPVPFLDTACPERWRAALDRLAAVDFALLVPGHGTPMERAAFETYRKAFGGLLDCAASTRPLDECTSGWQRDAGILLAGSDLAFVRRLLDYYAGQVLRGDPARLEALCGG